MACTIKGGDGKIYYRQVYPEKNAVWYTPVMPQSYRDELNETCRRLNFKPTPASNCSSTFDPYARPTPNQCLKKCTGIDVYAIDANEYEKMLFKTKVPGNGCISEPSIMNYTNVPAVPNVYIGKGFVPTQKNYPNVPSYGQKGSSYYNPVEYVFGKPYDY